jgi:transposase
MGKPMNKKLQKAELDAALVKALVEDSSKSYLQLAREFGVSINYLTGVVQRNNLTRKRGKGSPAWKLKKQAA